MFPSHRKTIGDIIRCRTRVMGGKTYSCPECSQKKYSYHSCNNRSCPKCGGDDIEAWIKKQLDHLLPVCYFFVTFTLPHELNAAAFLHQKVFYNLYFQTSARALMDLARDPRFIGGKIGFLGVLQSWSRKLNYHLHIHYIIPAAALSLNHKRWIKIKNKKFFIHWKPLSRRFKYLFQKALRKTDFYHNIPAIVWTKEWRIDCKPVGYGSEVIKYVAPYIQRGPISNRRIIKCENNKVTFTYKDSKTNKITPVTLPVLQFMRRLLQHVFPLRFTRVRYYGIMGSRNKDVFFILKKLIFNSLPSKAKEFFLNIVFEIKKKQFLCPQCGHVMVLFNILPRGP